MDTSRPTQVAIAEFLRVKPARVTQMKLRGMPVDSCEAAADWYRENINHKFSPIGHGPDAPPPDKRKGPRAVSSAFDVFEARAKREHHEAEIAEMKARQLARELTDAAKVRNALTDASAQLRMGLERIPDRIAPQVASMTDEAAINALLEAEIAQVLSDMTVRLEQQIHGVPDGRV